MPPVPHPVTKPVIICEIKTSESETNTGVTIVFTAKGVTDVRNVKSAGQYLLGENGFNIQSGEFAAFFRKFRRFMAYRQKSGRWLHKEARKTQLWWSLDGKYATIRNQGPDEGRVGDYVRLLSQAMRGTAPDPTDLGAMKEYLEEYEMEHLASMICEQGECGAPPWYDDTAITAYEIALLKAFSEVVMGDADIPVNPIIPFLLPWQAGHTSSIDNLHITLPMQNAFTVEHKHSSGQTELSCTLELCLDTLCEINGFRAPRPTYHGV